MRMIIHESAMNDFSLISELAHNCSILTANLINPLLSPDCLAQAFQIHSQKRKLRKPGIYVKICLEFLDFNPTIEQFKQIIYEYLQGIKWNDLQYISFIIPRDKDIEIDLVFNRVTLEGNTIDLTCLGAKSIQYDILHQAYLKIANPSDLQQFITSKITIRTNTRAL